MSARLIEEGTRVKLTKRHPQSRARTPFLNASKPVILLLTAVA
jgi:hypothetical protein